MHRKRRIHRDKSILLKNRLYDIFACITFLACFLTKCNFCFYRTIANVIKNILFLFCVKNLPGPGLSQPQHLAEALVPSCSLWLTLINVMGFLFIKKKVTQRKLRFFCCNSKNGAILIKRILSKNPRKVWLSRNA